MQKHILIILISISVFIFHSCESNDSPLSNNTPPPQNVPTNKVLVELFTNTSCIPCVEANQYLDAIKNLQGITNNDTNIIIIRYHTTLFAGDPFYLYNEADNNARMSYYPNSAIVNPRTFLLGTFMGNYSSAPWTNKLNEKLIASRPLAITLVNSYDTTARSGNLTVNITQPQGVNYTDLVYHIAISENEIPYAAPNGETHFNNTFRKFITPAAGQTFEIGSGQTISFNKSYNIASAINQHKTELVAFVQISGTKEILAVEKVNLP